MAKTAPYQLRNTDVRVNSICPGLIETGMTEATFSYAANRGTSNRIGQLNPMGRYGIPEGTSLTQHAHLIRPRAHIHFSPNRAQKSLIWLFSLHLVSVVLVTPRSSTAAHCVYCDRRIQLRQWAELRCRRRFVVIPPGGTRQMGLICDVYVLHMYNVFLDLSMRDE